MIERPNDAIAGASKSLTPLSQNIENQGPGGQAYELAPTPDAATHHDTPQPRLEAWKSHAVEALGDAGRSAARMTARTLSPLIEARPRTRRLLLGTVALVGLALLARGLRQRTA
jgi:hypothetical protein